ncbi:hypothetical protein [Nocardiopsis chromatogenes]|uniref:hypothetical protein n=1 Tax=Nocardiopsis chromatogenes TaxID=280239 RepID=UPI00034B43D7|nr:hypothetical protein [Nocardiopsis chromatogenes]
MSAAEDAPGGASEPASEGAAIAEQTLRSVRQRLASLDDLPAADHVAVFDALHQELSDVLGSLDRTD